MQSILKSEKVLQSVDEKHILGKYFSKSSFLTPTHIMPSAWLEHASFSFWLIEKLSPRTLVELGTHWGYSYFTFCQIVDLRKIYCQCFAVDTWVGDEHAGSYGEEVWESVQKINSKHYSSFSQLIRSDFQSALPLFSDGEVDFLHIDGRHYYDDIKRDFETWRKKLSDRGVVIFHDIVVRSHEFGVYKLWDEIKYQYPSFEFLHNNGLGVLCIGSNIPQDLLDLCALPPNSADAMYVRQVYAWLGQNIRSRYMEADLNRTLAGVEGGLRLQFDQDVAAVREGFEEEKRRLLDEASQEMLLLRSEAAHEVSQLRIQFDQDVAAVRAELEQEMARLCDEAAQEASRQLAYFESEKSNLLNDFEQQKASLLKEKDAQYSILLVELYGKTAELDRCNDNFKHEKVEWQYKSAENQRIFEEKQKQISILEYKLLEKDKESDIYQRSIRLALAKRDSIIRDYAELLNQGRYAYQTISQDYESLREQNNATLNRLHERDRDLRSLRLSTSWRITKPFRAMVRFILRVIPGMAIVARHRQMFGIKATATRIAGVLIGQKGRAPVLPSWPTVQTAEFSLTRGVVPQAIIFPAQPVLDLSLLASPAQQTVNELGASTLPEAFVQTGAMPYLRSSAGARSLLYISGESHTPGHQYRVVRYAEAAKQAGHRADWIRVEDLSGELRDVEAYDAIIIWRALWSDRLQATIDHMKARGRLVIFDVDDLMVEPELAKTDIIDGIRSQYLTEEAVKNHYSGVRRTMMAADVCFAATERLAYHMRSAGKPVHVIPNGFDQRTHDFSREAARQWKRLKADGLIRIGYAGGSRTHQKDLALAIGAVARILREQPDTILVLFREERTGRYLIDIQEYHELSGLEDRIEWRPLQPLSNLPVEMARFDINLAPLEVGNPFCESKSELKFFEAALLGVPTIASPTQPFRAAMDHGKTGFLATSEEDWYAYLRRLVLDVTLRFRMGQEAYHAALAKFGPAQRREHFARIIDSLWGGRAGAQAFALETKMVGARNQRPKVFESELIFEKQGDASASASVIIPLYNYENYIIETLDSIKSQTMRVLDLVVVDGFSTDNSLNVALNWIRENSTRFNRCVLLKNIENYGLGYCRNSGVAATDTPYYIPVDADNKLLPHCCEGLLETIEENKSAFAYSIIQQFGASRDLMGNFPYEPQRFVPDNYIDAMAMVSKEAWAMIGGYDHIKGGWEDYDFWVRMAENGLLGAWRSEILAEYRVHSQSMMRTQTLVPANRSRMHDIFKGRHPWVSLGAEQAALQVPHPQPLSQLADPTRRRFVKLLPILMCPRSKQKLVFDAGTDTLVAVDGTVRWSVREGRPILMDAPDLKVMPEAHISNDLPLDILDMMAASPGLVLNLSAGGTRVKYDNVIEAEFAIFRNTDVVTDAHSLPFQDEAFELIVSMNAFEHYHDPVRVAAELRRVLKPGGRLLVRTAFLQPLHEPPWHFYNCTRYGLENWFAAFDIDKLHVSDNFNPVHSLAWMVSELEAGLRSDHSDAAADGFVDASIGDFVRMWRSGEERQNPLWTNFEMLSQARQDVTAAGFELLARRPADMPKI